MGTLKDSNLLYHDLEFVFSVSPHRDSQSYLKCLNGVHRAIISVFALQERPSWIACISGLKTLECETSAML